MSAGFDVALCGGADAPRLARHAIAANDPTIPPSVRADVSLLVTELVTNAVRHGARRPTGPSRSSSGGKPTGFAWR